MRPQSAFAIGIFAFCLAGGAAQAADPIAGRALAENLCSGCHLISDSQRGPVSDGVPAFAALARDKTMLNESLRGFILDPHPQMPRVSFTAAEIEALIAYIRSLSPAR